MSAYYTWHDVEMQLNQVYPNNWYDKWQKIDVYSDEIVIKVKKDFTTSDELESFNKLRDIFGAHFSVEDRSIKLDYKDRILKVLFEIVDEMFSIELSTIPLFKEYIKNIPKVNKLNGVPIIAFHSYKGGVGRTLSLLTTVRALSTLKKENEKPFKLLIIDGDIEAPGLTWLALESKVNSDMSLIDAFSIIHDEEEWRDSLPFIARKIKETALRIPAGDIEVEHYFLPAYRENYQIISMPITPENLVLGIDREFIIADFLSELGKELNADAVLIDLRAGISEFAAPLLFDPRVRKVYVTSTSLQSRRGLQSIFEQVYKLPLEETYPEPVVFVSMVPDELKEDEKDKIYVEILKNYNCQKLIDDNDELSTGLSISFLPFSSNLVHLEDFYAIDKKLSGTSMLKIVDKVVIDWFVEEKQEIYNDITKEQRKTFLNSLIKMTQERVVAESNIILDFLTTVALKNITLKYTYNIPISVILGAKGSGKTFTFRHIIRSHTWENFVQRIQSGIVLDTTTQILPFLRPKNSESIDAEISESMNKINPVLGFNMSMKELLDRIDEIELFGLSSQISTEAEWKNFWKHQMLKSTGLDFNNFEGLQEYLEKKNKRIMFAIDGLEEIFLNIISSEREKTAVRALCQGIVNELRTYPNGRIGILIFLRRDIAMNAIKQNWEQFSKQYEAFELKWTHTEALRLVLWLVNSIDNALKPLDIPIESATYDVLEKTLYRLWGMKLGKSDSNEAFSANWILAALSDFNKQLQARDIIRFLLNAATDTKEAKNIIYDDRYLAPTAIKKAIPPCSFEKIREIGQEMRNINPIFEKLKSKSEFQRQIPFQLEDFQLTSDEAQILEQQGFFKKLNDGCYMPEIIRHGLGFRLPKGARPKVLTLIRNT